MISKLLGVEFDSIWQRHKRLLIFKCITFISTLLLFIASLIAVWIINQPVDVKVQLNITSEKNEHLPPLKDAVIRITLDNETKTDTIPSITSCADFTNIPGKYVNKEVQISVQCHDFNALDTTLLLTEHMEVDIRRNPDVYGKVRTQIYSPETERGVSGVTINIAGQTLISDSNGYISTFIPLKEQREKYPITSSLPLVTDTLCMPSGEDDVLLVK